MTRFPVLLAGLVLASAVALPRLGSPARPLARPGAATAPAVAEVERLRRHFSTVRAELEARDVSHLTLGQRAARLHHIEVLQGYADAGRFPHNHDGPGRRVPYFVDRHGTLCAMAHLIAESGSRGLVERIAASRNEAYIPELAGDPELVAWLDAAGLSVEEAARIQPTYNGPDSGGGTDDLPPGYTFASLLNGALGGATIAWNVRDRSAGRASRGPGFLGILSGAVGIAIGIDRVGDGGMPAAVGAVNAGLGIASLAFGARALMAASDGASASAVAAQRPGVTMSASAVVAPGGRPGLVLRARF